jgi:uncharacterized protein
MNFDEWSVILLCRAPNAPSLTDRESAELQDSHLAFLAQRHEEGKLLAAGPTGGPSRGEVVGVCLYAMDAKDARAAAEGDPAVKAGHLRVEVLSWATPADAIRPGPGRFPRSMKDVEGE